MIHEELFHFLLDLQENNHKAWMDEHRDRYEKVRDEFIAFLDEVNNRLVEIDPEYHPTSGRSAVVRINNNLLYHPDRPTYKDHFGGSLDTGKKRADYYIQIGIHESFLAGGYYHPSKEILNRVRAAIDYDGDNLKEIIEKPSFKHTFSSLIQEDRLKTAPKGYSQDHQHIEFLRLKHFAVSHDLTQEEVLSDSFLDKVIEVYMEMLPFRAYLNKAVEVEVEGQRTTL